MSIQSVAPGKHIPDDINVIIEIAANNSQVKYEVDKDSGLLVVDRFMPTAMHYPCDYGYIPSTLADDGDPVDVLVMTPFQIQPGCLIRCRVLGMLNMTDEGGRDSKLLAVPIEKVCRQFSHIQSLEDVPQITRDSIVHFFEHYKDLEPEKWVKLEDWVGKAEAEKEINAAIANYK
jgi:inorganic pyrophosphatase